MRHKAAACRDHSAEVGSSLVASLLALASALEDAAVSSLEAAEEALLWLWELPDASDEAALLL